MSQVETVALWAGLISSVAGIVLSIVAMVFAIWVNNRASDINNQMIRSLQKIESSVERVSTDTRELITAGWNKMLGGIPAHADADQMSDSQEELSTGIAAEARSELLEDAPGDSSDRDRIDRIERALEEIRETVAAQLRSAPSASAASVDLLLGRINRLPIEARSILDILASGRHVDRKTYRLAMSDATLRDALKSLRRYGLLVPLEGLDDDGNPVPVYHLPPGVSRQLKIALKLSGGAPDEIRSKIMDALVKNGYRPKSDT